MLLGSSKYLATVRGRASERGRAGTARDEMRGVPDEPEDVEIGGEIARRQDVLLVRGLEGVLAAVGAFNKQPLAGRSVASGRAHPK